MTVFQRIVGHHCQGLYPSNGDCSTRDALRRPCVAANLSSVLSAVWASVLGYQDYKGGWRRWDVIVGGTYLCSCGPTEMDEWSTVQHTKLSMLKAANETEHLTNLFIPLTPSTAHR
ncbi:hypothetical protein BC936DRAFT_136984 [Jimgerdemannia flammicorona]|uniref:Uncharacterized protein n=1 Tax=Jimgerdemannia flammicorona TaxID=994334 RepID=A0A433DJ86_9FUNG|nr:hypothetical protein BC936DRAFT_136984 [Jimgerdemannia flammicorona]